MPLNGGVPDWFRSAQRFLDRIYKILGLTGFFFAKAKTGLVGFVFGFRKQILYKFILKKHLIYHHQTSI
jgi:hypothetical protein